MVERMLIGYDGSEEADDSLLVGAALARKLGSEVVVGASFSDERLPSMGETLAESFARESEALLGQASSRLEGRLAVPPATSAVVRDSEVEGLADLASSHEVDLVVIGSTHRGGVGRVLPGALALQLIGSIPCPLAIAPRQVPQDEDLASGPIIAAFDGGELSKRALTFAAQLAGQAETPLHVIGVAMSQAQVDAALSGYGGAFGGLLEREPLQKELDREIANLPRELEVEGRVLQGSAVETLVNVAGGSPGIFVSGSHGRGPLMSLILGSVSNAVAQRISWPAVLVPPQAKVE